MSQCFYQISRKKFIECNFENELSECTSKLANDDWNTYLSFYNHADNLCFYYKGIIWQEESEKLINALFDSAASSKNLL